MSDAVDDARRPSSRPLERMRESLASLPLPLPSLRFRHRAWVAFQRALDPLAPPRPLPRRRD